MGSGNPRDNVHTGDGTPWSPVIRYLPASQVHRPDRWAEVFSRDADSGFSDCLISPIFASGDDAFLVSSFGEGNASLSWGCPFLTGLQKLCDTAGEYGMGVLLDLPLDRVAHDGILARRYPQWYISTDDPRARRLNVSSFHQEICDYWRGILQSLLGAGVRGFRCDAPQNLPPDFLRDIIRISHAILPSCRWIAWTAGLSGDATYQIATTGVDLVSSSVAWWNRHDPWFVEEWRALPGTVGRLACPVPFPAGIASSADVDPEREIMNLRLAGATGDGMLVPAFAENETMFEDIRVHDALLHAGRMTGSGRTRLAPPHLRASSADNPITVLVVRHGDEHAPRMRVILINPSPWHAASACPDTLCPDILAPDFGSLSPIDGGRPPVSLIHDGWLTLESGEVRVFETQANGPPIKHPHATNMHAVMKPGRIAMENVTPAVDPPRFAVKAETGTSITVEADIFMDGHDLLAARLSWRAVDDPLWRHAPMEPIGNSRWRGFLSLDRVGPWEYTIEAWQDRYASLARSLEKKQAAGRIETQDIADARVMIHAAMADTDGLMKTRLARLLDDLLRMSQAEMTGHLLSAPVRALMDHVSSRPFLTRLATPVAIFAERPAARYGSWYELFPRSQGAGPDRHGTLRDVIGRLPYVRDMGFDVLYLPPIHPIGRINRKGRNNSLQAQPGDPGSPYAIGSAEGGHDAIHPQLGTIEDFRDLVRITHEYGMELAMDFAIQCAPDHPWITTHPQWFDHRADGSIRHAENPPKIYEDIVNVDFYAPAAIPDLWHALRDVVLFWIDEGIRIFRVDNPHTKPLPFWEWLIADIRARHPDVIFLSEAFTHPKMMYRLAKAGFSQSYTYFTWRNTKQELTSYMTEITSRPVRDFFRPHLFVNTPDINPFFLQDGSRAAHLIRMALAATLSGLWGMYQGFELCEATPLAGREEYMDSEKYQIRTWDDDRPGNIIPETGRINAIRRHHRSLQTHLGLRFYNMFNDSIIYFAKGMTDMSDVVLVAVSLDPVNVQQSTFEIPLWEWRLPDSASLRVHDLMRDRHEIWTGKIQHVRLDPGDLPFAIWHVRPVEGDRP
ncbi:alpha-1,4-glucan--maltose-1-phosphate maltosyltransferase [Novacetimonas pomaceti]|uniref:alpha-1,4-glucan--maltose-1-phosphate maltosyltransferase n=1 Tax=Novacetimonas pomaceti TaxID=2021998 RepID=UPI001C2CDCCE|nr:alpha-1,4-glucan--maltose-1-phosphate maltosyltransferase [Novacetimonas pomaceti]MBV1833334.1 alpha-1,4-glucan--maltose-1-phosphate maltosyltransferase [Novacetimonas pomaceti]